MMDVPQEELSPATHMPSYRRAQADAATECETVDATDAQTVDAAADAAAVGATDA